MKQYAGVVMFIVIFGIVLVVLLFRMKRFKQKFLLSVYTSIMYALELILCIFRNNLTLMNKNPLLSVVLMIFVSIIILLAYTFISNAIHEMKKE